MKRYYYKVKDINNFDRLALLNELAEAKIPIIDVHIGNGMVVFEMSINPDFALKTALKTVVDNHKPKWFKWEAGRNKHKRIVRNSEDIDRITSARIRNEVGGDDPMQTQLKILREYTTALDVRLNPSDFTPSQIIRAQKAISRGRNLNLKIENIRKEGKTFKTVNNLKR